MSVPLLALLYSSLNWVTSVKTQGCQTSHSLTLNKVWRRRRATLAYPTVSGVCERAEQRAVISYSFNRIPNYSFFLTFFSFPFPVSQHFVIPQSSFLHPKASSDVDFLPSIYISFQIALCYPLVSLFVSSIFKYSYLYSYIYF